MGRMKDKAIDLHNLYAGIEVGDLVTDPDNLIVGRVTGFGTVTIRHWPCVKVHILTGHQAGTDSAIVGQVKLVKKGQTND